MTPASTTQLDDLEVILDDPEDTDLERSRTEADTDVDRPSDGAADITEFDVPADALVNSGRRSRDSKSRLKRLQRIAVYVLLPVLALAATAAAAFFRWYADGVQSSRVAGIEAVEAARESVIAMLAYQPDNVEQNLHAAADRLTGDFRDVYGNLVDEVVIPGARDKKVTTLVTVPTASVITATSTHAVVLVYVDQHVTLGADPPTDNATAVKMTLDKVDDRWLVSGFDPI